MVELDESRADQVLRRARQHGILRPRDLAAHGIAREYLRRLTRRGLLERAGRGLYVLPSDPPSAGHSWLMPPALCAARRAWPQGRTAWST
ncbi:MAG: type IV toxin-antitoxin system AbiEi family antitoxin domain-containing protein [Chloroflexi bacterium]|nr:type IV toxin-antitoxin system AbiEi family antitoxin domain-containing protein [Chloroflexota bacterium]